MATQSKVGPWRIVSDDPPPLLCEGRGSALGPDTSRRTRWWELVLDCGHRVERTVRYVPQPAGPLRRTRWQSDVMPAPKRIRCEFCPRVERRP